MTAEYKTKVHARNRNSDYGIPVTVYAENRQEAINKAVDIGWNGYRRDALVTVLSVQEVKPTQEEESEPNDL